jgi:hypothetical protein
MKPTTKPSAAVSAALLGLFSRCRRALGATTVGLPGPGMERRVGILVNLPLFMFMVILGVAIFFLGHRLGGGHRHWGSWQTADRPPGSGRSWAIRPIPRCKS